VARPDDSQGARRAPEAGRPLAWLRTLALGLVVGGLFLALALWGVPLAALGDAFARMDWAWLAPVALVVWLQYLLRAARQLVLLGPLAPSLGFRDHLAIVAIGFFCVNVFPARLGEAVRPLLFAERAGVPLGAGFALVLVERVVDLVAILLCLLGALAWVELPAATIEIAGRGVPVDELVRTAAAALLAPVLLGLLALALVGPAALRGGERAAAWLEARARAPFLHRLARGLLRFGQAFVEGLHALRSPARLAAVAALTALLFASMGLMMAAFAHAFAIEDRIGFVPGVAVLSITMLGIALPAPPGFAGVFEASARAGLALFGVRGEALAGTSLAFALVLHWWPFLLLCALAAWFLWRDGVAVGRLFRFARGPS
jgi:uncharacterized protein (TIRG00374 family)